MGKLVFDKKYVVRKQLFKFSLNSQSFYGRLFMVYYFFGANPAIHCNLLLVPRKRIFVSVWAS